MQQPFLWTGFQGIASMWLRAAHTWQRLAEGLWLTHRRRSAVLQSSNGQDPRPGSKVQDALPWQGLLSQKAHAELGGGMLTCTASTRLEILKNDQSLPQNLQLQVRLQIRPQVYNRISHWYTQNLMSSAQAPFLSCWKCSHEP